MVSLYINIVDCYVSDGLYVLVVILDLYDLNLMF